MVKENPQKSHYVHPTGLAFALTGGLLYVICATFVALWPSGTISFFSKWFHGIDITEISASTQITLGNFAIGLAGVVVTAYLAGAFYAFAYNKCVAHCKKRGWIY